MMHFIYDPILGLRYSFVEICDIELDFSCLPSGFTWRDFIDSWSQLGISLVDSADDSGAIDVCRIYTNIEI